MSIQSLSDYPQNRIAIVANGKEQLSPKAIQIINSCKTVIAADGGINLCRVYRIKVDYLIGDLDSVEDCNEHPNIIRLNRDKDIVDLEAAIVFAKEIDAISTPILFNALGGRLDHHLNNLLLLFKYPGTQMYAHEALIRTLQSQSGIYVNCPPARDKLFSLWDDVLLNSYCGRFNFPKGHIYDLESCQSIQVQNGQVLLISFTSILFDFSDILLNHVYHYPYRSAFEEIHLLCSKETFGFKTVPGLTISLIPWLGSVSGVKTTGLKWELLNKTLDYNFLSISNIATGYWTTVSINEGSLLCIIEKAVIREEFVDDYSALSTSMNAL